MGWIGWLLLIFGLFVAAYAVTIIAGMLSPPRPLAVRVIKTKLTALGIDPLTFSDECIGELADNTINTAKLEATVSPGPWRSHLQSVAETTAEMVHAIVVGEGDYSVDRIREETATDTAPWAWRVLVTHDPKRFALDTLETMQDTNAFLRSEKL